MGLVSFFQERDRKKTIKKLQQRVDKINELEPKYVAMTDEELANQTVLFKERYTLLSKVKLLKEQPSI